MPALEQADRGTGVLIANSSTATSVRLTLRKMDGTEINEQVGSPHQISIPAYGHRVLYLRDLYPTIKEYRGTLTVESGYGGDWLQEGGSISVMLLDRDRRRRHWFARVAARAGFARGAGVSWRASPPAPGPRLLLS